MERREDRLDIECVAGFPLPAVTVNQVESYAE